MKTAQTMREDACLHLLNLLDTPQPDPTGGKPYRYRCISCSKLLKILSGQVVNLQAPHLQPMSRHGR